LTKSGTGKLTLTANQTFTGDTLIASGVLALSGSGGLTGSSNLVLSSGATLDVTAKTGTTLGLSVGQTLKGRGTVLGSVSVNNLSTISPGDSVGMLATGAETWASGGTYLWEINHATTPGNWDNLTVSGILNVTATAGNKFTLRLVSPSGPLPGFNSASNYSWTIATTTAGVFNFDPSKFSVDASGLGVNLAGGTFALQAQANNVVLIFTPYAPPAGPTAFTSITPLPDGNISLVLTAAPGQTLVLQSATNLTAPISWSPIFTNLAGPAGAASYTDTSATNFPLRFYRIATP
jgi:autotransporter-associated beta strand protein